MTTHAPDKAAREAFPLLARIDAYFAGSYNRVPHHEAEFLLRKCRDVVAAHDAAMAAEQHPWPFVNSPQEVADKMSDAFRLFEGNMLAALRHVFIEKQEPVTARIALQAAQQREAELRNALTEVRERLDAWATHRTIDPHFSVDCAREIVDAALATQPASKGETT